MTTKTRATLQLLRKTKRTKRCADLVDFFSEKELRLWYRLELTGIRIRDGLEPVLCNSAYYMKRREATEDQPKLWPDWADELDLGDVLGVNVGYQRKAWLRWALENGVAPGQPFLIGVTPPDVYRCGYETVEYDVEWSGELLEVRPLPASLVHKRWAHFLRKAAVEDAVDAQQSMLDHARLERDTGHMYLSGYSYQATSDSYSWPRGYCIRLCTKSVGGYYLELSSGRSDTGDKEEAMRKLCDDACASLSSPQPADHRYIESNNAMSIESINLLRERVVRAAIACVKELEERESILHTKGSRALVRAVKALEQETWRQDEAPHIIKELLQLIEQPQQRSTHALHLELNKGALLRAKAFLGERQVLDDTTPPPKPSRGILRRK